MKRNTLIIAIAVVVVLAVAVVYGLETSTASAAATTNRLQTTTVQRGTLVATVSAAGNVSAPQQSSLTFQTTGRVATVNVQAGDMVKQGQVLMTLDSTDLQLALKSAQANLAGAQANFDSAKAKDSTNANQLIVAKAALDKATAALKKAQSDYDAVAWRSDIGMLPQSVALQQATDDYKSALGTYNITAAGINDTALRSAQAQLDNAQVAVDQAQRNLDKATLVAPFDGVVAAMNYNVGDNAGASSGSSTTSAAATLVNLSNLQVKVTVAEVDIPKIKVGETAQMTLDALPGKTYTAKVIAVNPVGTVTQGVVNYPVTVAITNADNSIEPGMTSNLNIVVDQRQDVLLVPLRAVRTQGNQKIVTVVYKGQTIQTPVTTGLANDQSVEITSGLQQGDVVVMNQTTTSGNNNRGFGGGGIPFVGRGG